MGIDTGNVIEKDCRCRCRDLIRRLPLEITFTLGEGTDEDNQLTAEQILRPPTAYMRSFEARVTKAVFARSGGAGTFPASLINGGVAFGVALASWYPGTARDQPTTHTWGECMQEAYLTSQGESDRRMQFTSNFENKIKTATVLTVSH